MCFSLSVQFHTKEHKENHQQVYMMSQLILDEFFSGHQPSEEIIQLMQTPLEKISKHSLSFLGQDTDNIRRLIAIVLGNPKANANNLISFAQQTLYLSKDTIMHIASVTGRLDIFKRCDETRYHDPALHSPSYIDYYISAAAHGQLDVLIWISQKRSEIVDSVQRQLQIATRLSLDFTAMIDDDFDTVDKLAVIFSIVYKHSHIFNWFKKEKPELVEDVITGFSNDNHFFVEQSTTNMRGIALATGILKPNIIDDRSLSSVFGNLSDIVTNLAGIIAKHYLFFSLAIQYNIAALKWYKEQAPNLLKHVISMSDDCDFRQGARFSNLECLKWLREQDPDHFQDMIAAHSFETFSLAATYRHDDVVNFLLSSSTQCFAFAEMHDHEYGERYIYPFVQNKLAALHNEQRTYLEANPNTMFDITDPNTAKLYFYIARNIIHRNTDTLNHELRFLFSIPSIRALAATEVTPHAPNELYRLAITIHNGEAQTILREIPAVIEEASRCSFYYPIYCDRTHRERDECALARNRESSMVALTADEQKLMDKVTRHYQKKIEQAGGIENAMNALRSALEKRYTDNPAKITVKGKVIQLPVDWQSFQNLHLHGDDYQAALEAYYQHADHTALRFLSKPNHWMSERASFVVVDERDHSLSADFNGYREMILILWYAANDPDMLITTDGMTIESRLEFFYKCLALLGRAHNWDNSRINNVTRNEEEYDDREGDKPSCFSGMKRRLFQSLIGHPLLDTSTLLTLDVINQDLNGFVYNHFTSKINSENAEVFYKAYLGSVENIANADPLKALDISKPQQDAFIQQLEKKYGSAFGKEFKSYVENQFIIGAYYCHAMKFGERINLRDLLTNMMPKTATNRTSEVGFFRTPPATTLDDPRNQQNVEREQCGCMLI